MAAKILFVDDEIEMGFMVSNLLKMHGYEVVTAESVEMALELSDGMPLSAIILDINLAGEDGFQLMTYLKRNHPEVPIIIYSGMEHDEAVIQKALSQGASQYIRKGGPLDDLVTAVRNTLPGA